MRTVEPSTDAATSQLVTREENGQGEGEFGGVSEVLPPTIH